MDEEVINYLKLWRKQNSDKVALQWQRARDKLKMGVLRAYSYSEPVCAHCGITDVDLLCVDHINGGGKQHLKSLGISGGQTFYTWLRRNNYPEGYQVLCWNCNHKKEIERRRSAANKKA